MIKPIDYESLRKEGRIPKQKSLTQRIARALDKAVMEKFNTLYRGHPFTRTHDNKYHLDIGSLEVTVYMKGANIVTELRNVPDADAESALIRLLAKDEFFTHEKSPIQKKKKTTIDTYVKLFRRKFGCNNEISYVPKKGILKAKKAQVIDTIINYMIKPLLFLLPGPSKHLEKMY